MTHIPIKSVLSLFSKCTIIYVDKRIQMHDASEMNEDYYEIEEESLATGRSAPAPDGDRDPGTARIRGEDLPDLTEVDTVRLDVEIEPI